MTEKFWPGGWPSARNAGASPIRCVRNAVAGLLFGAALPAFAQTPPPTSGAAGQQQIRGAQDRGEAFSAQSNVPGISIPPQIGDEPLPVAQQQIVLPVSRIDVEGSTVYDAAALAPMLQPHIGRPNTVVELRALAARLTEQYRRDGYPFTTVRVPGQQVFNGRVRLQVREFSVTSVVFELEGREVPAPERLRPSVAAILAQHPVRAATLEAAAAEAARLGDVRVATTRYDPLRSGGLALKVFLARAGTDVVAIQPASFAGRAAGEAQRIAVRAIRVVGNTVMSAADLAPEFAGVTGREASLAELRAAADRVAARYAAAGYFGTSAAVPPQVVTDGVVTIEVAELAIARVSVSLNGQPLPAGDLLSRAANRVTDGQIATTGSVQRQLYVMSNVPGVLVESVIPPVPGDPAAEVYLRREPITFTTAVDNRGTSVAGPMEWGGLITTQGLLGLNEQIQLQALSSIPFGQVRYIGGLLVLPLTSSGLVGTLSVSRSDAYPGGYLASTRVQAFGDMISLGLSYPVIARADLASLVTLGFDGFNNTSSIFDDTITTSDERSRAVRLGSTTTFTDGLGGTSSVRLVVSKGIDGLGARPNGTQVNTRPGIQLDAAKVVLDVSRTQPLPGGFKMTVAGYGQRASGVLPSAEVMTFGGVNYGRAFDSGIISGDHGIAGKVMLSRLTLTGNSLVPVVDPYVFYDIGMTSSARRIPGVRPTASAASTGIGTRFMTKFGFGGSVEADLPLTHGATFDPGETRDKAWRVFFLLFMQY